LVEHPEKGIELTYDRIFSKPLTGDPAKDGFTSTPSAFMVEAVKSLKAGRALDVGTGQGRNALWLAQQGWDVTGIDISGAGLAAARANAGKVGRRIATVKTTYDAFDFGTGTWDLIVMILSWAPVSDPAFVARLSASLRPGGVVVFEHVIDKPNAPFQKVVHALQPNELRTCFKDFLIEQYEEAEHLGDWGGPPTPLVRMVAKKK
jgi:2-polyprenyl-3-methyl-5-hydroxy-6-metoxy-1,4-benzoquinol methylase